ncbi:hypothetical protein PIB30_035036 [Stylosanthes scabra]|uniref:Uncharacterized protein n=1 Tax=Stylosanthes scabra TaxID=79078 RepID=A0ABU6WB90_9FABA|nr:hypothetical protein [Stylosanthes scabra]
MRTTFKQIQLQPTPIKNRLSLSLPEQNDPSSTRYFGCTLRHLFLKCPNIACKGSGAFRLQRRKHHHPNGRVTFLALLPGKPNICRIRILVRYCLILKLNKLYAEQGKPSVELNLRDWH